MGLTSKEYHDSWWCVVVLIILMLFILFMTGCANMPSAYFQAVRITSGPYRGNVGRLIGDCSGFENYNVKMWNGKLTCVRIWNMEVI